MGEGLFLWKDWSDQLIQKVAPYSQVFLKENL